MRIWKLFTAMVAACLAMPLAAAGEVEIWHKAESAHFTIYSSGDRDDLVDFTREYGRKAVKRIGLMRETGAKFPPELPDEDRDETAGD